MDDTDTQVAHGILRESVEALAGGVIPSDWGFILLIAQTDRVGAMCHSASNIAPADAIPAVQSFLCEMIVSEEIDDAALDLVIDPERVNSVDLPDVGFKVTARDPATNKTGQYDITDLTTDSLILFMTSRGGKNEWAEGILLTVLGHRPPNEATDGPS